MKRVMVICAHSDDQIIGPGGAIAKYANEGKAVYTIIFSYGESSHPWFQRKVAVTMRVKEAKKADKFIGGKGVFFLGLKEGKIYEEFNKRKMYKKLKDIILKYNPEKIFTHSSEDFHPDHKVVSKIVTETCDKMKYAGDVYSFDVWNIFNFKRNENPRLIVDISETFKTKIKALSYFKSQNIQMKIPLTWLIYLKAFLNGIKNNVKYAEVFYKIR